jgi:hypothetical protein
LVRNTRHDLIKIRQEKPKSTQEADMKLYEFYEATEGTIRASLYKPEDLEIQNYEALKQAIQDAYNTISLNTYFQIKPLDNGKLAITDQNGNILTTFKDEFEKTQKPEFISLNLWLSAVEYAGFDPISLRNINNYTEGTPMHMVCQGINYLIETTLMGAENLDRLLSLDREDLATLMYQSFDQATGPNTTAMASAFLFLLQEMPK